MKLEGEEIGHIAKFGGDGAVETVAVKGEVLEETELGNFRGDFPDEAVAHQLHPPHNEILGANNTIPLALVSTTQPNLMTFSDARGSVHNPAIFSGEKFRLIPNLTMFPTRRPRQRIQRKREQRQHIPLIQPHIVRIQLHLVTMQDPLQCLGPRIGSRHTRKVLPPLQNPRLDLLPNSARLAIRGGGSRGAERRCAVHQLLELGGLDSLGGLGRVDHHYDDYGDDDHEGHAGVHPKTTIFVQGRLGVGVVFDGGVNVLVFGGRVDGHGDGEAVLGESGLFGFDIGVGFFDRGGDGIFQSIVLD
mmetsp:Transcript_14661/g.27998  ORF Transcript_14661/g.27998 Transcript_14661/m.27998 type:complete len:303 (-) Transcript_14661:178-1086(-)